MDLEFYITIALSFLVSYLFGALPFADRISKRKGVNIFQIGNLQEVGRLNFTIQMVKYLFRQ